MKRICFFQCLFFAVFVTKGIAQSLPQQINATAYRIEAFGSASTGQNTPLWMVSNTYGVVPLEAGNGSLRTGVFHNRTYANRLCWNVGLDAVSVAPRDRSVYVQQLYAEIGYKSWRLKAGSKEEYTSLFDRNLSSGDMVLSPNARPIPEINLSIPSYTAVPYTNEWLAVKGDFAVGNSFDSRYLAHDVAPNQVYIKDVLWHHKSLYFRLADPAHKRPLSFEVGVQHWAQWGGTSYQGTTPQKEQPQSIKDFLRVVAGMGGDGRATNSDQINVLGNHYGGYTFQVRYAAAACSLQAYHQHFFEDKSGIEMVNWRDGLYGIRIEAASVAWLHTVVVEYLETRHQSGAFHFIDFDHQAHPGRGGGRDNYYNNEEYTTGASYFNRGIGSPLLTSPEYNANGKLGFENNRINGFHVGLDGDFSSAVAYRLLLTHTNGWGTAEAPFRTTTTATSGLIDILYTPPRLSGWVVKGSIAADTGTMYGKGVGCSFSIAKRGLLKAWR